MSRSDQLSTLIAQRSQLVIKVNSLGGTLDDAATFAEIASQLASLELELNPSYEAGEAEEGSELFAASTVSGPAAFTGIAAQLAELIIQRDAMAERIIELGVVLYANPTFQQIHDALNALTSVPSATLDSITAAWNGGELTQAGNISLGQISATACYDDGSTKELVKDGSAVLAYAHDAVYPWTQSASIWQSGNYNVNNTTSTMIVSFTLDGASTLSFDWACSSESKSWDYLYYTITKDGEALSDTGTSTKIGGNYSSQTTVDTLSWTTVVRELEPGQYSVAFTYRKDSSAHNGLDAGFVRNLVVTGIQVASGLSVSPEGFPIATLGDQTVTVSYTERNVTKAVDIVIPVNIPLEVSLDGNVVVGETVTASVKDLSSDDAGYLTYQWHVDGMAVNGEMGDSYVPAYSDYGKALFCEVTIRADQREATAKTAEKTVGQGELTGTVTIDGSSTVTAGETYVLTVSNLPEGAVPYYTWYAIDLSTMSSAESPIILAEGADVISYTVDEVAKYHTITVNVTDASGVYSGMIEGVVGPYSAEGPYAAVYADMTSEAESYTLVFGVADEGGSPITYKGMYRMFEARGIEETQYDLSANMPVWFIFNFEYPVYSIEIIDEISPISIAAWFTAPYCRTISGLENIDTSNVTDMSAAFLCAGVSELSLSTWDTSNVASFMMMFGEMPYLEKISFGDGFRFLGAIDTSADDAYDLLPLLPTPSADNIAGADGLWYSATYAPETGVSADTVTLGYILNEAEGTPLDATTWYAVKDKVVPDPTDPELSGTAYALLLDNSANSSTDQYPMVFMRSETTPTAGEAYAYGSGTATIAKVYSGFETANYYFTNNSGGNPAFPPWSSSTDFGGDGAGGSVTSVTFEDAVRPRSLSGWFYWMPNCTSITGLEKLDTSRVTDMSVTFAACAVTELDLSGFDTSRVTNMTYMFLGSGALTTIYASDSWTTKAVTSSDNMFQGCDNLVGDVAVADMQVYDKTYAKTNGGYLTDKQANEASYSGEAYALILDNSANSTTDTTPMVFVRSESEIAAGDVYTTEKYGELAVSAAYADIETMAATTEAPSEWFEDGNYDSVTSVTFVDAVRPVSTAYWFFCMSNCTAIDLTKLVTSRVTDMTSMFNGCSGLASLDVSGFNTSSATDMTAMFGGCSGLVSLDVSSFNTSRATETNSMFSGCSGLASLDVSGFNTSNVTNMTAMFSGCSGLTSLDLSSFDTSNVTVMNRMFKGCSGLVSLDVSSFNTSNVKEMEGMFQNCSGFTSLDLSNFDMGKAWYMPYMFKDCSGLTSLDLSSWNTPYAMDMSCMFQYCSSLTTLDVSNFETSRVSDMTNLFLGCSSIVELDLSGWNTSKVKIMSGMFEACSSLVKIYASELWSTESVNYSVLMFYDCINLKGDISYSELKTSATYATTSGGYLTYKAAPSA